MRPDRISHSLSYKLEGWIAAPSESDQRSAFPWVLNKLYGGITVSEKELTPEELEKAAGGRKRKMGNKPLSNAGTTEPVEPNPSTGPTFTVEPLPDPPFQS